MSGRGRLALAALIVGTAATAAAQPVGTFQWQLEPYCNVLTLEISRSGDVYRLEGTDDQCTGTRASVVGTAAAVTGGEIGLGMSIVAGPGAAPVHVSASLGLPSMSGTWRDSAGHAGAFVPTTGTATTGVPRPATGMGVAVMDTAAVQRRVSGSCAAGRFITSVDAEGGVTCSPFRGGTITRIVAGPGLTAFSGTTEATLMFRTFGLGPSEGLVARAATEGGGTHPISGQGRFFAWSAGKGAFRAGEVFWNPGQWNVNATGRNSVGMGRDARAYGDHSASFGDGSVADGRYSLALSQGYATGLASVALGQGDAHGSAAFASGLGTSANGSTSVAMGANAEVPWQVPGSFVFGDSRTAAAARLVGGANQFNVRADGVVVLYSNAAATTGVETGLLSPGWHNASDRRLKSGFRTLSGEGVLARLARLPIREWNYVTQDAAIRHLGPTAQDFHAAFGLGESTRQISTVDADGIALAALRAIEARTRVIERAQRERREEEAALGARLERLEQSVMTLDSRRPPA